MSRSGGCQCGAVRFEISAGQLVVYACHCRDCQKQTASAFALSIPVRAAAFTVQGPLAHFGRATASGATTNCFFCTACGTRIYHTSSRSPGWVTVKGGALDEITDLSPLAHLWVESKQPWTPIPEGVARFDTQPDDLGAWRANLVAEQTR